MELQHSTINDVQDRNEYNVDFCLTVTYDTHKTLHAADSGRRGVQDLIKTRLLLHRIPTDVEKIDKHIVFLSMLGHVKINVSGFEIRQMEELQHKGPRGDNTSELHDP